MMKLNSNESRSLEFGASIQGVDSSKLEGSLKLRLGNIDYGFPVQIKENEIIVDIPKLDEIIKEELLKDDTVVEAKLEIFGEGFYLNPWNGNFHIKVPVKIEASIKEDADMTVKQPEIKVTVGKKDPKQKDVIIDDIPPMEHGEEFGKPVSDKEFDTCDHGDSPSVRKKTATSLIVGENKKPKAAKKKNLSENKKPKTKEQILKETFVKKLGVMSKKDRIVYLKALQEKSRIAKIKKAGAPKTPRALMESVGMTTEKMQNLMLDKAEEMGGSDPRSIMTSLEVLLGVKKPESTFEQLANTNIGKKMLSD